MFSEIAYFFDTVGVNMVWPVVIVALSLIRCMVPNELVSKVKEIKNEDGSKEYHIYKIK